MSFVSLYYRLPLQPISHSCRLRVLGLMAGLVSLAAPASFAQEAAAASTCVPRGEVSRVIELPARPVYATLEAPGEHPRAVAIFLGTLLQEIARVFVPPDSMPPLPTYSFSLRLHKDGRLTDAQPVEEYIPPSVAVAMIRAIDSVSRSGGIGPVFFEVKEESLPLRMVLRLEGPKTETSVPFYRLRFPAYFEFETDKPALSVRGNPTPVYPEELRSANIEGEVLVQFVVDTMGRADMRTFRILGPPRVYREFAVSVIRTLPKMRFTPAERRGCKVKQLVQLPFAFKLNR
jgi:TonB family protein